MDNKKRWQRVELLLFTIITILNLLPYISTRFFPSMDGASHLVNSNIINQLLVHKNELFREFFSLNPEPVPNWTSHFLISVLMLFMPSFMAEKILIIILLGGIPWAFRSLLNKIKPSNVLYSYLIFPFTHSMFLFFGFYNFCMAILFFLITLIYWLNNIDHIIRISKLISLTLLVAITYFSHILVFGALLIVIALYILTRFVLQLKDRKPDRKTIMRSFIGSTGAITLASLIPLALFAYFFISRPGTREIKFIPKGELLNYLFTIRPLISFNTTVEGRYTTILFIVFVLLIAAGLIYKLIRLIKKPEKTEEYPAGNTTIYLQNLHSWWLLSTLAVLSFLYFLLPDAYGTASYTNLRLALMFFILLIISISTLRLPWGFGLVAVVTALTINTILNRIYQPSIDELGQLSESCYKASEKVKPNSLVLPIYVMDNWFTGHFVDYLAVDKPVVMVYNYECESGYFPVMWNFARRPNYYMGNPQDKNRYVYFDITKDRPARRLDYVFILGQYDPAKDWFFSTMHGILTEQFRVVYQAGNCSLYENLKKY